MANTVFFDGKFYTEPVVVSRILGGLGQGINPSSFGNILIIDTTSDSAVSSYGNAIGSLDSLGNPRNLEDMLYQVNSISQMRGFFRGGRLWDVADYLYSPSPDGNGASTVFFARAAQTVKSVFTFTFASAKDLVIDTKVEGTASVGSGNAPGSVQKLAKGFGITMKAGPTSGKFIFEFWVGTYRGQDENGMEYSKLNQTQAEGSPHFIVESDEVNDIADFYIWADSSAEFAKWFEYDLNAGDATGAIAAGDLVTYPDMSLFVGGTDTYSVAALDAVLDRLDDLDFSFILAVDNDSNATSASNLRLLSYVNGDLFKKIIFVGGSDDDLVESLADAVISDTEYFVICHCSSMEKDFVNPSLLKEKNPFYTAAVTVGINAGIPPQTPCTQKRVRFTKMKINLILSERVTALKGGVLHMKADAGRMIINQGVNTEQVNEILVYPDGSSYQISVTRIKLQINKEIQILLKPFIGGNVFSVSEPEVEAAIQGYMDGITVDPGKTDGMILRVENIKATRVGTNMNTDYSFVPNVPIDKIFSTGTIIDPSL